jgi:ribosome-associated protein
MATDKFGRNHAKGQRKPLTSKDQALHALDAALDKKALEPVLLDVSSQASYTDYILLVSGNSDRHVQTIAEAVVEAFAKLRKRPIGVEGVREGQWALIDFGDLVVHVFYHPMRDFYDLEGLWCDARRVAIDVPAEARAGHMY